MKRAAGVRFTCPMCGARVDASGASWHLKRNHPGTDESTYTAAVETALSRGTSKVESVGGAFQGRSGTQALRQAAGAASTHPQLVPGGSPGLRKRRT